MDSDSGEIQAELLPARAAKPGGEARMHDSEAVAPMLEEIEQPIESCSADGAYDRRNVYEPLQARSPDCQINIPPRKDAHIWQHGNCHAPPQPRDENLRYIRKHGRQAWKCDSNYHRCSLSETAVFRLKTIFGDRLSARLLATQTTQARIRCRALNIMTHLGMLDSYKLAA